MIDLKGLATGIGSLPHKDPDEASDLIFKFIPEIPFWPQLPRRDVREGMIAQFSENLPCLRVSRQGLFFESQDKDKELETFYDRIINNDLDYFKISEGFAAGLYKFHQRLKNSDLNDVKCIKCHITGPFTFASGVKDENGVALLHDPVFLQALIKGLSMKAAWQVKYLSEFGKKIIVFIDEPYLGCFGSAYTPVNRDDAVKGLTELAQPIKSEDCLLGVHCCGNTDWSILTDAEGIDIISFDAFNYLERFALYADSLKAFLEKGGIICWGIVPTNEFSGKETPEFLAKKIKEGIDVLAQKGVNKGKLLEALILSPACGLGTLSVKGSEQIFSLLNQTSKLLIKVLHR